MRRLAVLILAASSLSFNTLRAQFSEFAVTDDGRLYFTTPLATEPISPARSYPKIYRYTGDGLALHVAEPGDFPFSAYVSSPLTSGDGSITAYARYIPCVGSCMIYIPRTTYFLQGAQPSSIVANSLQISRNGRFLLASVFDPASLRLEMPVLIETATQRRRDLGQFTAAASRLQAIANDGTIVFFGAKSSAPLLLAPLDGAPPHAIAGTENATAALLSPNGAFIAYERTLGDRSELVLTDPLGSSHRLLASVPRDLEVPWPIVRFRFQASFANDGTLLYLQPDSATGIVQPMIVPPGGEPRLLVSIESAQGASRATQREGTLPRTTAASSSVVRVFLESAQGASRAAKREGTLPRTTAASSSVVRVFLESGVQSAIVSGDGDLVWLATFTGQLLRVRTADAGADEMIASTPYLPPSSYFAHPGSVVRLPAPGLPEDTQVALGDLPLPLTERNSRESVYQIPWEYPSASAAPTITVRGPRSPFRQELGFTLAPMPTITFEVAGPRNILQAAHDDFRGVVSPDDPARPGETIHVFARNMGPVDRPVATGQPSPSDPPARVTTPLACYLIELDEKDHPLHSEGISIPFAGLSGGSIGVYQIDVTIPPAWTARRSMLQCRMADLNGIFRGSGARIDIAPTSPQP